MFRSLHNMSPWGIKGGRTEIALQLTFIDSMKIFHHGQKASFTIMQQKFSKYVSLADDLLVAVK